MYSCFAFSIFSLFSMHIFLIHSLVAPGISCIGKLVGPNQYQFQVYFP